LAHRIVGVDFGHGVIRAVEVEDPGTKRQRTIKRDSIPFHDDAIASGEVRDVSAVSAALKQLWQKGGFKTRRVVLGLGNARVLARDLEVPVKPLPQVRESLPFLVADLLPMPLENAVLDYYPISIVQHDGGPEQYSGMLVAALKDVAMTNARAAQLAGLEVAGIDMIPFAIIRTLAQRGSGESVAFVDVGATTTIISVATDGVPEFVRTVPSGSEDVSRALMELGGLGREQAEQVKRTVGLTAEGVEPRYRPVVELMVTRTSDLMTSIRDTISYFADTRHRHLSRIVLTGGGARLGGFPQMVSAWTRIPAVLSDALPDMDYLVASALATGAGGAKPAPVGARTAAVPTQPAPTTAPARQPQPVPAGVVPTGAPVPLPPPMQGGLAGMPQPVAAAVVPGLPPQGYAPPSQAAPAVAAPLAGAQPAPPAPGAQPPPAPAPEPQAAKPEKKQSIWNRPLGGGRK